LTQRESGVSPHILYEVGLGLRSGKPLLVFVEDTLPPDIVPANALQRRFSFRSYLRSVREHRQSLVALREYIGEAGPRYQGLHGPRTCLLLGAAVLGADMSNTIEEHLRRRRKYEVLSSAKLIPDLDRHPIAYGAFGEINVAIAFDMPGLSSRESRLVGEVRGANLPMITLAKGSRASWSGAVPVEYQPRKLLPGAPPVDVLDAVSSELEIYEEDFLELQDGASVDRYMQFLVELDGRGRYSSVTRKRGVEVIVGDTYDVRGQTGAVGPNAHVHDVSFNQIWSQRSDEIDLAALAGELSRLRVAMRGRAGTPEEDQAVADIGQAELSAKSNDGPGALQHLRRAGQWALDTATSIGVNVAAAAIKAAAGF